VIANVSLIYENVGSGTTLSLSGNYVSDLSNDEANKTDTTEEEFFLKFYAEQRIQKNISAYGWVENITGETRRKVKVENGTTTIEDEDTGRAFFLGLKMKF
jgi:outer membrane receptor protein involved in Fe transport